MNRYTLQSNVVDEICVIHRTNNYVSPEPKGISEIRLTQHIAE